MKKVYLSGRMTGLPRELYFAHFRKAEELLRKEGFRTCNPARFIMCRWPWLYKLLGYNLTLCIDLYMMARCDMIYKIPGWKESRGANIESCAAYHLNVWPVDIKVRQKIDKKLAKYIDKLIIERAKKPCQEKN